MSSPSGHRRAREVLQRRAKATPAPSARKAGTKKETSSDAAKKKPAAEKTRRQPPAPDCAAGRHPKNAEEMLGYIVICRVCGGKVR